MREFILLFAVIMVCWWLLTGLATIVVRSFRSPKLTEREGSELPESFDG